MYVQSVTQLGRRGLSLIICLGRAGLLLFAVVTSNFNLKKLFPLFLEQLFAIGVRSIVIISVSGLFIGMVLALQGYNTLVDFGAEQSLGPLVALSLLRELGPVVTALLFAGRVGSSLTAEIGLMKATEQLASLEMMAIDPIGRVIVPRFWAGVVSMPLLTSLFNLIGIYGAKFVGVDWLGADVGGFWSAMQAAVDFNQDLGQGLIKSVVFAVVVTWIALFNGYDCVPTSQGLGKATTQTVVYGSLAVLGLDFILTAIMFG